MKREEFDALPYTSREELIQLRKYCLQFLDSNSDVIYREELESVLYQFKDITGKFAFNIRDLQFDKTKKVNTYKIYFKPASSTSIEGLSLPNKTFEEIRPILERWMDRVRKMHAITEEYYNPDAKFYNDEFVDFFINNDEDSATEPFDIKRQEVLYYFLTYAEKQIKERNNIEDDTKIELLEDIQSLKENIPNFTKKKVVSTLSKIAQKTKKISNKLFHDIFDVLKKEAIKKILYEGIEQIPNAIKNIENWISLLT
jgi:glutamyl/glutaminyl-tRNA synthetase